MTTKDFIMIADAINKIEDNEKRNFVLEWFLKNIAKQSNDKFDKKRFINYYFLGKEN